MADSGRREAPPRARVLGRRSVPSERPGRTLHSFVAGPKLANDALRHQFGAAVVAADEFPCDAIDFLDGSEESGVSGDSTHRVGILVVNLANQQPLAERAVLGWSKHLGHRL